MPNKLESVVSFGTRFANLFPLRETGGPTAQISTVQVSGLVSDGLNHGGSMESPEA